MMIPNFVLAGQCASNVDVNSDSTGRDYTRILVKGIATNCNEKYIMNIAYFVYDEEDRTWVNQRRVASSMFKIMGDYCNFDKQIKYDIPTGYLVCEYKKN